MSESLFTSLGAGWYRSRICRGLFVLTVLPVATLQAGRYPATGTQAFSYANGSVPGVGAWNDGTSLISTAVGDPPTPIASVMGNALRLTGDGQYDTAAAFKIPDLDGGQDVGAVTVSFSLKIFSSGTAGQGMSVNFGAIPESSGGRCRAA
jgi:hypothetical protein